jgi:hypothetical protein
MIRYVLGLAAIVVFIVSCSPRFPEITDPSKRLNIVSGVSVLPPQEPEWHILLMTQSQLSFAKRSQTDGESYATVVWSYDLPHLDTEQDYLKMVSEGWTAEPQTGRHANMKHEENLVRGRGAVCVHFHVVYEDNAAQIGTERKFMVMESIGYHCQHPKNKHIGVRLEYSHRHFPGNDDTAMEAKANAFLDQVLFTDF